MTTINDGIDTRISSPLEILLRTIDAPTVALQQDLAYEARKSDLPFLRNFERAAKICRHPNDPAGGTSTWGQKIDNENQTVCGIPTNTYIKSGVAIHPYFRDIPASIVSPSTQPAPFLPESRLTNLNLPGLCIHDVHASFWRGDGIQTDMMIKVTDICLTDPSDPAHCSQSIDIKVDQNKIATLFNLPQ